MAENFEQKSELQVFREKMWDEKRQEEKDRAAGVDTTGHFSKINPDLLSEEDMKTYQAWESGILPLEHFNGYRNRVCNQEKNLNSCEFAAYVANLMMRKGWNEEFNGNK